MNCGLKFLLAENLGELEYDGYALRGEPSVHQLLHRY